MIDRSTLTLIASFKDLKIPLSDDCSTNMTKRGLTNYSDADMLKDVGQ